MPLRYFTLNSSLYFQIFLFSDLVIPHLSTRWPPLGPAACFSRCTSWIIPTVRTDLHVMLAKFSHQRKVLWERILESLNLKLMFTELLIVPQQLAIFYSGTVCVICLQLPQYSRETLTLSASSYYHFAHMLCCCRVQTVTERGKSKSSALSWKK